MAANSNGVTVDDKKNSKRIPQGGWTLHFCLSHHFVIFVRYNYKIYIELIYRILMLISVVDFLCSILRLMDQLGVRSTSRGVNRASGKKRDQGGARRDRGGSLQFIERRA